MLNKRNLIGHETIENCPLKILNNNFSLHKTNAYSFADFPYLFGLFQINLFLFAGVVVLLYVSVTPVEAHQCGYHYHTNDYFTIYYSTYYKRCYPIYYGYCYNTVTMNSYSYCVVEIINHLCLINNIKILNVCVQGFVDLLMINNSFYTHINKADICFLEILPKHNHSALKAFNTVILVYACKFIILYFHFNISVLQEFYYFRDTIYFFSYCLLTNFYNI